MLTTHLTPTLQGLVLGQVRGPSEACPTTGEANGRPIKPPSVGWGGKEGRDKQSNLQCREEDKSDEDAQHVGCSSHRGSLHGRGVRVVVEVGSPKQDCSVLSQPVCCGLPWASCEIQNW